MVSFLNNSYSHEIQRNINNSNKIHIELIPIDKAVGVKVLFRDGKNYKSNFTYIKI